MTSTVERPAGPEQRSDRPPLPATAPRRRLPRVDLAAALTVALVLLGTAVRLRQWSAGRSLWLDEALLAASLVRRDLPALLVEPLLHNQSASTLWLLAEGTAVAAFGDSEQALRLVPLLGSVASLVLAALLARLVTAATGLPRWTPPLAVGLLALHPELVWYGNELKPYSVDVAVVLALLLVALHGRPLALGLAGAVGVWAAFPAVFVLAGASAVLALRPRTWAGRVRAALLLAPWLVSFAVEYVLLLRPLSQREVLGQYWAAVFPDGDLPAWLLARGQALVEEPLALGAVALTGAGGPAADAGPLAAAPGPAVVAGSAVLVGVALALGAVRLLRRAPVAAGLLLAGVPFAVLAGAVEAYPLAGRLALWLVPLAALLLAALAAGRAWPVGLLVVALLAGPAVVQTAPLLVRAQPYEELEPVLREVADRLEPGDQVLVDIAAKAAFDHYAPRLGVPRDGVVLFRDVDDDGDPATDECEGDVIALRTGRFGNGPTWLVFSHDLEEREALGPREDLLSRLGTVTRLAGTVSAPGAEALLLDPSGEDLPPAPRTPGRCLVVNRSAR